MKVREELGQELHEARSASGLSLEATSRAAKISQGYLHKLEAGNVQNPSPRVLQRLSEVLGVSYGRLMQLADYLMPGDEMTAEPGRQFAKEVEVMAKPGTEAAPTNRELARLLEAVLGELAEVRRSQDELAQVLKSMSGGRGQTSGR